MFPNKPFKSVVLPVPLRPNNATCSPFFKLISIPVNSVLPFHSLLSPFALKINISIPPFDQPAFGQTKWVYGYTSSRNDEQVCHPKKAHTCPVRPCSRNILSEFFFKHTENTVLLHSGQDLLKHLLLIIIRISPYIVNAGY